MSEYSAFWMWKGSALSMCLLYSATIRDRGDRMCLWPSILTDVGQQKGMCLGGMICCLSSSPFHWGQTPIYPPGMW